MRVRKSVLIVLLATLAFAGVRANSQANVNENQKTFLYVDTAKGSDSNPGTAAQPLKTIGAAVSKANANNQKSIGTKIIVNPGVYREFVNVSSISKQTSAPLTLEAAVTGAAIVAGSDVLTGWSQDSESPLIYSHSWNYNFGNCAIPSGWPTNFAPVARRTEMVFVNGTPLTQVMSHGELRTGTFYVSESANQIYISPASSTNISTATIEAAVRPETIHVHGRSNVVLRGLVFRHAADCINQNGAVVDGSTNVLVDSIQALWNNWGGFTIGSSSNVTVQNSVGSYNGGAGLHSDHGTNVLFSFNESDYNNWRGAQAAFYDWGMGGTKFMWMRNTTVQDHFAYNNQAQGLWFDTDNVNITVNNSTLVGNVQAALQIERNEGPITVEGSRLCSSGVGANVLTSESLTIKNNTFYNNGGAGTSQAQIFVQGTNGGQVITNYQTGQNLRLFTKEMVLSGNTFEDGGSGQYVFGTYLDSSDWSDFANSLNASNNKWYDASNAKAFRIVNGKQVNLSGWVSATGTDQSSDWEAPATSPAASCAAPAPTFADFSMNLNNRSFTMSSGKATATVRVNSFSFGPVSLSMYGLPAGVTASFSKQNLTSGVVTLTLTAAKTAKNQTVPVTLYGTGNNRTHAVTFYLHVIPA